MTLNAEAFRQKGRGPGLPCRVVTVLQTLSPSDRDTLEKALADPSVQHARIEEVLKSEGIQLPQIAVARHRRRQCRCFHAA